MSPPRAQGRGRGPKKRQPDWSELALPLPTQTAERILSIGRRPGAADNVGLWLDKLVQRRQRVWTLEREDRTFALKDLCTAWQSAAGKEALARLGETVRALHPADHERVRFRAKLKGRLLVGHGRAAATETSVSFHTIWGVPNIPGSALKGVALAEARAAGLSEPDLDGIFGSSGEAGRVIFYDALPTEGQFSLALDVLTPHHRAYYQGDGPATDWDSPEPFTFVTVANVAFEIWLGARSDEKADVDALASAAHWLDLALRVGGVGGKTAAGYGRFETKKG